MPPTACPSCRTRLTRRVALGLALVPGLVSTGIAAPAAPALIDLRQRVAVAPGAPEVTVLTLDACGGAFDAALLATLVRWQVPATVFVTGTWIARQPAGVRELLSHQQLFELENHGAAHRPAVLGGSVYGMPGAPDRAAIAREIDDGAAVVQRASGRRPLWFRGAGAHYDATGLEVIAERGHRVAGYSVNADDGGTASAATVTQRLLGLQSGDIVLGHLNRPAGGMAEGLAQALPRLLQRGLRFVRLSEAGPLQVLRPARPAPAPRVPGTGVS
jgi:peptidoglycan/xylan/chitin deacetylase (PgdA/CDA1 family)